MTRRTRKIMFFGAVGLFLILSYIVLLYAQGYKYSFPENKFFRTGAIFVKTNESAKVFVQDELAGTTSFLGNSLGIDRLLPGQYVVRLQKDGYSSWQKTVTVQEGLVTDFTEVMLLRQSEEGIIELTAEIDALFASTSEDIVYAPSPTPKPRRPAPSSSVQPEPEPFFIKDGKLFLTVDNEPVVLAEKVLGFSPLDDRILWWTNNELWVMWFTDTDYQPYRKSGDKELVTRFSSAIKSATWFRDEDHVVVDANGYKVVETDTRGGINIIKI